MKTSKAMKTLFSISAGILISFAATAEPADKKQLSFNKEVTGPSAVSGVQQTIGFRKYMINRTAAKSEADSPRLAESKGYNRSDRNI